MNFPKPCSTEKPTRNGLIWSSLVDHCLWPYHRERRDFYGYQKQLPSDYLLLLDDYLRMAPHLVPKDPALSHFRIRHPDLRPTNIIVSRSSNS